MRYAVNRRKQRGFTLTEVMIAIGVIAIILLGVVGFGLRGSESAKVSKTIEQVREVATATVQWGAGKTGYDSVSLSTLKTAGYLASNISATPFNGPYVVTGSGGQITITSDFKNQTVCNKAIDLVTNDTSSTPTCSAGGVLTTVFGS